MKRIRDYFAYSAMFGGAILLPQLPAHAASDTSAATATVIVPITITNTQDLAFGRFSANTGGTVVISTAGVRTSTSSVALSTVGSTQTASSFDITGDGSSTYTITLPTNGTVTIDDGASHTMAVNDFVSNPSATGTLSSGAQTVTVGATLTVGSGQTPGDYTGTFTVTVEYN
jgi:hypothetical protein